MALDTNVIGITFFGEAAGDRKNFAGNLNGIAFLYSKLFGKLKAKVGRPRFDLVKNGRFFPVGRADLRSKTGEYDIDLPLSHFLLKCGKKMVI